MQINKRLKELEAKISATGEGWDDQRTQAECDEYVALRTLLQAKASKTGITFLTKQAADYLAEIIERDAA